jgi:hypothetical protein
VPVLVTVAVNVIGLPFVAYVVGVVVTLTVVADPVAGVMSMHHPVSVVLIPPSSFPRNSDHGPFAVAPVNELRNVAVPCVGAIPKLPGICGLGAGLSGSSSLAESNTDGP